MYAVFYLVLAGSFFADLDDVVDGELHSLIKCVPKIIASNHLDVSSADLNAFIMEEAQACTIE